MEDLFFFATLLDFPRNPVFRITALKVLFSDDAPRTPKFTHFVSWFWPNSIRWRCVAAKLLPYNIFHAGFRLRKVIGKCHDEQNSRNSHWWWLVGFGRIVSDGILHAMVYDFITHPEYQSKGVDSEVLTRLVEKCQESGIRDIQLFCAKGKRRFYEKRGFVARAEEGPGMDYAGPK